MSRGGKREGAGRPSGPTLAPKRAVRAAAAAYGLPAVEALGAIVMRALAADKPRKKGDPPIDRPRDCDVTAAADKLLVWAFGRPVPDRSFHGLVGSYDMSKLSDEQVRTVANLLRLAAPTGTVGETD